VVVDRRPAQRDDIGKVDGFHDTICLEGSSGEAEDDISVCFILELYV
jgi:hypothetical protein